MARIGHRHPHFTICDGPKPGPIVRCARYRPTDTRTVKGRGNGFTLIEIAVVLGIVGLLLYFGIGIVSSLRENTAVKDTQLRLAKVREAIITFAAENLHLPCPADGTLASTDSNYGVAVPFGGEDDCSGVGANGVVPWVTLGLSDERALDGFARRISYRVVPAAADPAEPENPGDPDLKPTTFPGIRGLFTIHSDTPVGTGNQLNACSPDATVNSCNNWAVALLISHGENGSGAFLPGTGNRVPLPAGAREAENTDADTADESGEAFVQRGFVRDTTLPAGEFDDIVVWLKPGDILAPLVESGTIKTARGVVQDNINAIRAAIMGAILSDTTNHVPPAPGDDSGEPVVPIIDSGQDLCTVGIFCLPASAQRDPWNRLMRYTVYGDYPDTLEQNTPDGNAFAIWSAGPPDAPVELLRTEVTIGEVKGLLMRAGAQLPCTVPECESPGDGGSGDGGP